MGRAPCCDKANVKKGPWSPEEDAKLKAYIEKYGTGGNWIALPQKIGLRRCGKSCRLRWLNYLRPNIRHGGFTEEEDNTICSLYISIGSRWSIIAAQLPGRTDNDIKNYWNTRLKKKLLGRRKQSNTNRVESAGHEEDNRACNLQNLSSSAMERLQLHMQLQNPFSLHENPALWPKMIQTLQSRNESQNTLISPRPPHPPLPASVDHNFDGGEVGMCVNGFSSSDSLFAMNVNGGSLVESEMMDQNGGIDQMSSGFTQSEFDGVINDKSSSFLPEEMMDASRSSSQAWWPNEFDASWGLTTATAMFHDQSAGNFQDFV